LRTDAFTTIAGAWLDAGDVPGARVSLADAERSAISVAKPPELSRSLRWIAVVHARCGDLAAAQGTVEHLTRESDRLGTELDLIRVLEGVRLPHAAEPRLILDSSSS
jgi:hypothetical protein